MRSAVGPISTSSSFSCTYSLPVSVWPASKQQRCIRLSTASCLCSVHTALKPVRCGLQTNFLTEGETVARGCQGCASSGFATILGQLQALPATLVELVVGILRVACDCVMHNLKMIGTAC